MTECESVTESYIHKTSLLLLCIVRVERFDLKKDVLRCVDILEQQSQRKILQSEEEFDGREEKGSSH